MTVIGKRSPCLYLDPQGFDLIFSLSYWEGGVIERLGGHVAAREGQQTILYIVAASANTTAAIQCSIFSNPLRGSACKHEEVTNRTGSCFITWKFCLLQCSSYKWICFQCWLWGFFLLFATLSPTSSTRKKERKNVERCHCFVLYDNLGFVSLFSVVDWVHYLMFHS